MNRLQHLADWLVRAVQRVDQGLFCARYGPQPIMPAGLIDGLANFVGNAALGAIRLGSAAMRHGLHLTGVVGGHALDLSAGLAHHGLHALQATHQNLAQLNTATDQNLTALGHHVHVDGGLSSGPPGGFGGLPGGLGGGGFGPGMGM